MTNPNPLETSRSLKYKTVSIAILVGLIGCTTTFYDRYKAGKPYSTPYKAVWPDEQYNDITNCNIEAAQRVPQNIVVKTTPTYSTPIQTHCNQIGTQTFCNQTGGQTYGGKTTSTDTNAGLRTLAYRQCMIRKHYRFVDIPACPKGVDLFSQLNETLWRPLSRTTCYQANPDGLIIGDGFSRDG